jgi:hypothetical protein
MMDYWRNMGRKRCMGIGVFAGYGDWDRFSETTKDRAEGKGRNDTRGTTAVAVLHYIAEHVAFVGAYWISRIVVFP